MYTQTASPTSVAQGIQVCAPTQARCVQACPSAIEEVCKLTFIHESKGFSALAMQGNVSMTKFYTGLPSWDVFEHVYSILIPHVSEKYLTHSKLQPRDELFLVLVHLHLNLLLEEIAYRFGMVKSTVTTICNLWICYGYEVKILSEMGHPRKFFKRVCPKC